MSSLSFYVHIPYCVKRCGYCDFNTYTPHELRAGSTLEIVSGDYIDAVLGEIDYARTQTDGTVPTIFFGGGTPSLLPAKDLGRVISMISELWELEDACEITLEANPDSVDAEKLVQFREAGFNRISFGMQSAQRHVLEVLDRTHNPENIARVVSDARSAGFASVSLDLIYGTPGESISDWERSVRSALDLDVDHLSAYALIVESGTKLAAQIKRGELKMPDDDLMADMYLLMDSLCESKGLSWYELSNWAKPQHESRHNVAYWLNSNWWGLGPGAHSHINGVRWWNVKHPQAYKERSFTGANVMQEREILNAAQLRDEAIMLGIRLRSGIELATLDPTQVDLIAEYLHTEHLDRHAWDAGRLQLTVQGRLIADRIVRQLVL